MNNFIMCQGHIVKSLDVIIIRFGHNPTWCVALMHFWIMWHTNEIIELMPTFILKLKMFNFQNVESDGFFKLN